VKFSTIASGSCLAGFASPPLEPVARVSTRNAITRADGVLRAFRGSIAAGPRGKLATEQLALVLMSLLARTLSRNARLSLEGSGGDAKSPPGTIPMRSSKNFTVQRLDGSGKLRYTFSAPKMTHFSDDGSGEVLYPHLVQIAEDGGNFSATANRGTVSRQGEEAFLYGNVLILREGHAAAA